jgi:hypothetical protein
VRGHAGNGKLLKTTADEDPDGRRGRRGIGSDIAALFLDACACKSRHVRREVVTMVQKLIVARLTVNYFFAVRRIAPRALASGNSHPD